MENNRLKKTFFTNRENNYQTCFFTWGCRYY